MGQKVRGRDGCLILLSFNIYQIGNWIILVAGAVQGYLVMNQIIGLQHFMWQGIRFKGDKLTIKQLKPLQSFRNLQPSTHLFTLHICQSNSLTFFYLYPVTPLILLSFITFTMTKNIKLLLIWDSFKELGLWSPYFLWTFEKLELRILKMSKIRNIYFLKKYFTK